MRNTNTIRRLAHFRSRLEKTSRFYQHAKWHAPGRSMIVSLGRFDGTAEIDMALIKAGGFQATRFYPRNVCVPVDRFDAFVEVLQAADALARIEAPRARVSF